MLGNASTQRFLPALTNCTCMLGVKSNFWRYISFCEVLPFSSWRQPDKQLVSDGNNFLDKHLLIISFSKRPCVRKQKGQTRMRNGFIYKSTLTILCPNYCQALNYCHYKQNSKSMSIRIKFYNRNTQYFLKSVSLCVCKCIHECVNMCDCVGVREYVSVC